MLDEPALDETTGITEPSAPPPISDPPAPGRPRNPQEPPMTPDGDPQRRDEPANEPINPEPEQPPEPVVIPGIDEPQAPD